MQYCAKTVELEGELQHFVFQVESKAGEVLCILCVMTYNRKRNTDDCSILIFFKHLGPLRRVGVSFPVPCLPWTKPRNTREK